MKDLTPFIDTMYIPKAALVIYSSESYRPDIYVEYFDMDSQGNPINAHPLTVREAKQLAESLQLKGRKSSFLLPSGVFPYNVIHLDDNTVIWYTKKTRRHLYFAENLEIPSGMASIPPLVWRASKNHLEVWALKVNRRPTINSVIYNAPFFNIYKNGRVCMGTVDVNAENAISLEAFITTWQDYFFNSYFSHLLENQSPIHGNCINLWKSLVNSDLPFPAEVLKESKYTLKDLLLWKK